MFYFHSTSRDDLLSVWNHWVKKKTQTEKLHKVQGQALFGFLCAFFLNLKFDILPDARFLAI